MIKVSVIVPVYNAEPYLRECMDSLVCQTLREMEVICVNDGSTDRSLDILREYAQRDTRIRVISKVNSGYGHTMNIGIDAAEGKYIGFAEPDDYVRQDMYEQLYRIAGKLNLDIVKADFSQFRGSGNHRKTEYCPLTRERSYYGKVIDPAKQPEVFRFQMNTWTGIYKREFLNRYHIRHHETPGASFQDLGFWFQTFCLAERVYFRRESFYRYRRDNGNSSVHSREKVYAVCGEYVFMHDFLERRPELKKRYLPVLAWKKYHDYQFTATRIGTEHRKAFFKQFAQEFCRTEAEGGLLRQYFTRGEWRMLRMVMDTPGRYLAAFQWLNLWYQAGYYKQHYGLPATIKKILHKFLPGRLCAGTFGHMHTDRDPGESQCLRV